MKCEAAAAILASEGPAPVSVGRQHARSSCENERRIRDEKRKKKFLFSFCFFLANSSEMRRWLGVAFASVLFATVSSYSPVLPQAVGRRHSGKGIMMKMGALDPMSLLQDDKMKSCPLRAYTNSESNGGLSTATFALG